MFERRGFDHISHLDDLGQADLIVFTLLDRDNEELFLYIVDPSTITGPFTRYLQQAETK
jgi:hypothetical protein